MKIQLARTACVFTACVFFGTSAFAQATRTWVSGVGADDNPCSRTAPCKTFAGAIVKTATGGEISVLDPGGYGVVTITKPITISGVGEQSSILAVGATGINIIVTIPTTPPGIQNTVTLRDLQVNCAITPTNGTPTGIRVQGATTVIIDNVNVLNCQNGIQSEGTSKVSVTDGVFSGNLGVAIHSIGTSTLTVENSQINGNNIAVQADLGSTIRLTNNGVYDNKTGFACGTGGTLASTGNNRKAGNTGGVVATCTPTVAITVQ